MRRSLAAFLLPVLAAIAADGAVLKHSDVVFMYQSDRQTYADYGATVLGWGGRPTPKSLEEAKGVKFFGSVGMVTEFSRYYQRFPEKYEEGLCRDIDGKPVKVPWLTDHQHNGIPFWWCCTQQPLFRQYIRERVVETVKAGAHGVHIDDHMGTSGGLWLGICFCDKCLEGFRGYLQGLASDHLKRLGITNASQFDFRQTMKQWLALEQNKNRKPTQHPLWEQWTIYQCRAAAAFMQELHELANATAGKPLPMGANAGLLWPRHLADYKAIDLFSAETDHHASARKFSDTPIMAYRMADAVNRPYAATASGHDWAFIKEQNLPGLVRGWIALAYASGQMFMAPNRQWCYTPEKGTHWYAGPKEKFAPLYQFVRRNAELFDGFETFADVGVVIPHRAYVKNQGRWTGICNQLATNNISFKLLLGGDEIVDHPLPASELQTCRNLLVVNESELLPPDRQTLHAASQGRRIFTKAEDLVANISSAVRLESNAAVRLLPRVQQGAAIVHLLNYNYDSTADDVRPIDNLRVNVDRKALGVGEATRCRFVTPENEAVSLQVRNGVVEIPKLGLWGLLSFTQGR